MSILAKHFPIYFFDSMLYCEQCRAVQKFKIFSQEQYDKIHAKNKIPPARPLYCKCEKCGFSTIYATDEFSELQENSSENELCKIWDFGDFDVGDLVWHGEFGLCRIEWLIKNKDLTEIVLANIQTGVKNQIQLQNSTTQAPYQNTQNAQKYRILPQKIQDAKIGEHAYSTEQKRAGTIVGLLFEKGSEEPENGVRAVVKFGERLEIIESKNENFWNDAAIEKNANWRCESLPFFANISISVISKILFVKGSIPNLNAARKLEDIINSIPQIRCFVLLAEVKSADENSAKKMGKAQILSEMEIYKLLIANNIYIYNCKISIDSESILISGYYSDRSVKKRMGDVLAKLPTKSLRLDLKFRRYIKIRRTISKSGTWVRIASSGRDVYIDGWVQNEKQKIRIRLIAFFCTLFLRIKFFGNVNVMHSLQVLP